jgi:cytochrome c oxidase subunit II
MSRELRRFLLVWIVSSVVSTVFVALFFARYFWPGKQADASAGQVTDFTVGFAIGTPILCLILGFLVYVLIRFRQQGEGVQDGPRIFGHRGLALTWILTSVAIAVGATTFDVVRIVEPGAAGSGQGPTPLSPLRSAGSVGSRAPLKVQVIGQQWQFSYRYPSYGGVETPRLVLPVGRPVEFHVTSLDVIHSFWPYGLGVKADANPGVDNVAYTTPRRVGSFSIRCAELCGIWHGYMFDTGRVVSTSGFSRWIAAQQRIFAPTKRYLPPYSETYLPEPRRRAG